MSVPSLAEASTPGRRERPLRLRIHSWLRWIHIYLSMFTLLVVLFFALTGITLNHPEWVFGTEQTTTDYSGTLPEGWRQGETIDWLRVAEYMRSEHGVHGVLADYRADEVEGSISFKGPGYSADAYFDPVSGSYQLGVVQAGAVTILNDLHRGRDSGGAWKWLVDLSGVFLTVVALTGRGLLWYLKKLRVAALTTMTAGIVVLIFLMRVAV